MLGLTSVSVVILVTDRIAGEVLVVVAVEVHGQGRPPMLHESLVHLSHGALDYSVLLGGVGVSARGRGSG